MAVLSNLVVQSVKRHNNDPDVAITELDVYCNLDVRRVQGQPTDLNIHLLNPRNSELGGFKSREIPLTGGETVNGEFLTLHYCSHDGSFFLLDHSGLRELESEILGDAGIINPWTNFIDAFVNFHLFEYRVTFLDPNGDRVEFDKKLQYDGSYKALDPKNRCVFSAVFSSRKLEWL